MKVGIIGLGYVGLPLAVAFAQEGCDVIAVDVDPRKVEAIEAGGSLGRVDRAARATPTASTATTNATVSPAPKILSAREKCKTRMSSLGPRSSPHFGYRGSRRAPGRLAHRTTASR